MQDFDIVRYLGIWKELASIPQSYEHDCITALAVYSLNSDRTLKIKNYCISSEGHVIDTIEGVAAIISPSITSKLLVKFTCPFTVRGTYYVEDTDYSTYSIVSNEEKTSLWILSRYKSYTKEYKRWILKRCKELDLDTSALVWRSNY